MHFSCPPITHVINTPEDQLQSQLETPPDRTRGKAQKWALDLFSGTHSVGDRLKQLGYRVVSLDVNPNTNPTICKNLLEWDYWLDFPKRGQFEIIAASVPCTEYSRANTTGTRDLIWSDRLVACVKQIVSYYNPTYWWIENPRTGLLSDRAVLEGKPYLDLDYCQFSDWGYQKPTRFWGCKRITNLKPILCTGPACPNTFIGPDGRHKHFYVLGGNSQKFSSKEKGRIPPLVVDYLLQQGRFQGGGSPHDHPATTQRRLNPEDHKESQGPTQTKPCPVENRWLGKGKPYRVNQITRRSDQVQLLLTLPVQVKGCTSVAKVLVDTGAESNLIRKGFWFDELFYRPKVLLNLVAADGRVMDGGKRCVDMSLDFRAISAGVPESFYHRMSGIFYEAEIQVDAILSYPWLVENRLVIFPHLGALALDEPKLVLLKGMQREGAKARKKKRRKNRKNQRAVHTNQIPREQWNPPKEQALEIEGGDPELEKYTLAVEKMKLRVTDDLYYDQRDHLTQSEIRMIAQAIAEAEKLTHVRGIIQEFPSEEPEDHRVEEYRAKIHQKYDGIVLKEEVDPDPPVRGPYGEAKILLKEGAVPQRQKLFHTHGERKEAMTQITEQWEDKKFIERPTGPVEWISQGFAVPKKSTTFPWRGVVDMRGVNSQTRRANYPLPNIEQVLTKQGKNHIFSILDLRQAFHQQPMEASSRPITCTMTPKGVYQWRVNVMGLMNASTQFQQMMDDRTEPVSDIADAYIDDVIVGTELQQGEDPLETHLRDITRVLDLLAQEKLVADISKCKFFVREVEFCGHVLGKGVRRPAPGKLMAIEKWEPPKTITQMRAFLGFTNYYSTYIKDYAQVAARLQDKLKVPREVGKKGSRMKISWDKEDQEAFDELKRRLCSELVLQIVNPDKPFVLRVDASEYAVGATLEQLISEDRMPTVEDVRERRTVPVSFLSRKLAGSQRNWIPRELETYAIILALQKWDSWIGLQPVMVLTDHKALEHWAKEVLDPPSGPIGRRMRWHQILSKYDLSVGYIPGKENTICDVLSRWAYPASLAAKQVSRHGTQEEREEMKEIIRQEKEEERQCLWVRLHPKQVTEEDLDELHTTVVAPVAGQPTGGPPNPPPRFTFKRPPPSKPKAPARQTEPPPEIVITPPEGSRHEGATPGQLPAKPRQTSPGGTPEETNQTQEPTSSQPPRSPGEEGLAESVGTPTPEATPTHPPRATRRRREALREQQEPEIPVDPEAEEEGEEEFLDPELEEASAVPPEFPECQDPLALEGAWDQFYVQCPHWGRMWGATKDPEADWPIGVQIHGGRMFTGGRLCIPIGLEKLWIRHAHAQMGHAVSERLWALLESQFQWGNKSRAKAYALRVARQCGVCQATQRPRTLRAPVHYAPIPDRVMSSMSLDIMMMPRVRHHGKTYDAVMVSVDRHSGWIVAIPARKEGLTAAFAARKMLKHQWSIFGVPQTITTDCGSQFTAGWFDTMLAGLGVRHVFTHPYYHRAAGRVEVANQILQEVLRKINVEGKYTWVEALPAALNAIHNLPGPTGFSPYQVLFGRERLMGNIPYTPSIENEDAKAFFERMKILDENVAKTLNEIHEKRAQRENASIPTPIEFSVGQKVWYRRPEGSGDKLDSRWLGPALIEQRISQNGYQIRVGENKVLTSSSVWLKAYNEDEMGGEELPLYTHRRTTPDPEALPDEWMVDKVLDIRWENEVPSFKVHWEGYDEGDATWETANNFFHRYAAPVIDFCAEKGIPLDVTKFLSRRPH